MASRADLVLDGGRIVTLDGSARIVPALAIGDGKILAAGDSAQVRALAGAATKIVDLGGRTVIPGLVDAHAHMDREGLKEMLPSLAGCASIGDIQARIAALAARRPPGEWIVTMPVGDPPEYRDVPQCLAEGRFPTRHDLDAAAPDHPVYIRAIWGPWRHTLPLVSIANSKALALAGITRDAQPPSPSITIDRDALGDPTGIFIENSLTPLAEFTLMAAAPHFSLEERIAGLERSMAIYNALGTTSIFEGHGVAADVLAAYESVHRRSRATVRSTLTFSPAWSLTRGAAAAEVFASWGKWLAGHGYGDTWLRLMGMHAEIGDQQDHRLRARLLPQTGWAGFNYDANLPRDALKELLLECARSEVMVVGLTPPMLEMFAEVDAQVPLAGKRWSLGHIIDLDRERIARIVDMGLIVTTHTSRYLYREGSDLKRKLGPGREDEIVPLRSLLDAGVRVCLASDNVPPNLFKTLWHVVARRSRDGEIVGASQALTRMEALACASRNGAYLSHEEDCKGTLEPGKFADLAVLEQDVLACAQDEISDIQVAMTIVDGRIVHDAASPSKEPGHGE
jgi:predicted amidohydrolase YtcJ